MKTKFELKDRGTNWSNDLIKEYKKRYEGTGIIKSEKWRTWENIETMAWQRKEERCKGTER